MFNIPFVNRVSFLFFYLMSFQELLSDSLFTGIVLSSKTKQPISNVNIYTNQKVKERQPTSQVSSLANFKF